MDRFPLLGVNKAIPLAFFLVLHFGKEGVYFGGGRVDVSSAQAAYLTHGPSFWGEEIVPVMADAVFPKGTPVTD